MRGSIEATSVLAGRYRVDALIGRGAVAEVWSGHDLTRDWPVAVKLFAPQMADPAMRARFVSEARIAARVVHTNVVSVFDVGEHDGRPFLVMELLSGRSLAAEIAERGPLPPEKVRHLVGQAAAGLDAAHRADVVHRDIKPANLHLTADGLLKVVDFGIARLAGEEMSRLTAAGTVVGTAAYLSPEQILGHGGDAGADLYALGCVCYELLCGRPPFVGVPTELIHQHLNQPPMPPRSLRPDIPADLEALVLAMLAKEPAARPASAAQVRHALLSIGSRRAPGGTAVLEVPGPDTWSGHDSPRRWSASRLYLASAAFAALVGVLVLTILTDSARQGAAPPPSALATSPVTAASSSLGMSPSTAPTSTRPSSTTRPAASKALAWLAALDRALAAHQRQGGIAPDVARELRTRIAEAREKLNEGKIGEARSRVMDLRKRLTKARREGRLADGPLVTFLARSGMPLPPIDQQPDHGHPGKGRYKGHKGHK
ncbi:serine/threonine protein kinase [Nonomuraea longispora]|uniref:non-specific serine/threonine protein kinase n=1 Tax=Nonomuraea longispora TaxID=1848320 RepID=A0A4V2XK99_9ACTN|nr:serine/threonine-protein kinase [Nonomuraea longispora]TDC05716.1 serine/threonine protein kinase [Nonomuraea longispora]